MAPDAGQLFFEDTSGFKAPVKTGIPSPKISRSLSPESSSSSEEAIVFSGRSRATFPAAGRSLIHDTDQVARAPVKPIHVLEDSVDLTPDLTKPSLGQRSRKHTIPSAHKVARSPRRKSAPREKEDPSVEDYISNMKLNGLLATDIDSASAPADTSPADARPITPPMRTASTEQHQKSPVGDQPRFKPGTVDGDHADGSKKVNHPANQEDGTSVACEAIGSGSRRTRVADEQLARLLSKQEELGLGSNDLILYDGLQDGAPSDEDLGSESDVSPNAASRSRRPRPKDHHRSQIASPLPFHESYGDFDVMDFERPSLRRKSKAQRAKADFDVSDSDIQHTLQVAWKNDRAKKKAQKQERQELRLKGLLGKGSEKRPNLKSKYPNGISLDQIGLETETFMSSSNDNLCLPPMDAHARKIVHEIGHHHGLKSRSMGAGNARFPILFKTSRTRDYDAKVLAQVRRRFIPNPTKGRKKTRSGMQSMGGAGPGVSYRDGEIVGACAPELGQDNKGRAILEKMGWSTGTGLGASNSGLSAPVQQIVKTTRAGLG